MILNPFILIAGIIMSIIRFSELGNLIDIVFLVINMFLLSLYFYTSKKQKVELGVVTDSEGNVLSGIELGLYDRKFKKLLYKTVTDSNGKYRFFVPGGRYYLRPISDKYTVSGYRADRGFPVSGQAGGNIVVAEKIILARASGT